MKKIKYIAFYDINNKDENRQMGVAAINKIDYISKVLTRNNYMVEIISPSWTNNKKGFYKGNVKEVFKNVSLRTFATFGANNKITRLVKYIFSLLQLFFYLIFNTRNNEQVIVYHSVILSFPIRFVRLFKKIRVILEVEEIYQDAQSLSKLMEINEYKAFETADKFLLSTELLNQKINLENKASLAIYGTYQIEKNRSARFEDDMIHVVYAGTFDPRKGGGGFAASAGEFLPENYHLHIIGFGSKENLDLLLNIIEETSLKTAAKITYDGFLRGEKYIEFLQKCDIGLSTQIPDASYNDTSFPSKILSYMANGLRVVSVNIKAVQNSAIGNAVYYYDEQTPKSIAKAIMSIDVNQPYDSRRLIRGLDKEFERNFIKMLEN